MVKYNLLLGEKLWETTTRAQKTRILYTSALHVAGLGTNAMAAMMTICSEAQKAKLFDLKVELDNTRYEFENTDLYKLLGEKKIFLFWFQKRLQYEKIFTDLKTQIQEICGVEEDFTDMSLSTQMEVARSSQSNMTGPIKTLAATVSQFTGAFFNLALVTLGVAASSVTVLPILFFLLSAFVAATMVIGLDPYNLISTIPKAAPVVNAVVKGAAAAQHLNEMGLPYLAGAIGVKGFFDAIKGKRGRSKILILSALCVFIFSLVVSSTAMTSATLTAVSRQKGEVNQNAATIAMSYVEPRVTAMPADKAQWMFNQCTTDECEEIREERRLIDLQLSRQSLIALEESFEDDVTEMLTDGTPTREQMITGKSTKVDLQWDDELEIYSPYNEFGKIIMGTWTPENNVFKESMQLQQMDLKGTHTYERVLSDLAQLLVKYPMLRIGTTSAAVLAGMVIPGAQIGVLAGLAVQETLALSALANNWFDPDDDIWVDEVGVNVKSPNYAVDRQIALNQRDKKLIAYNNKVIRQIKDVKDDTVAAIGMIKGLGQRWANYRKQWKDEQRQKLILQGERARAKKAQRAAELKQMADNFRARVEKMRQK